MYIVYYSKLFANIVKLFVIIFEEVFIYLYFRWLFLKKICNIKTVKKFFDINFKKIIEEGVAYFKQIKYYVFLISENKLRNNDIKELDLILESIVKHFMIYDMVMDEIHRNISSLSR